MTEDATISDSSLEGSVAPEVTNDVTAGSTNGQSESNGQQETKAEEKLIPQSQVAKIAAREKREAEAKAAASFHNERMQLQAELAALKATQGGSGQQQFGNPQYSQADMAKAIHDEVQRMSQFNQAYQIAEQFEGKIKSAIMVDPDLGDIYDSLQIQKFPQFAVLANQFDNTAEIVREVGMNPGKFAEINMLINSGAPDLAKRALANLSASIKQNQAAQNQPKASEPLSQIKPSPGISVSDGQKSVSDFRKRFGGYR